MQPAHGTGVIHWIKRFIYFHGKRSQEPFTINAIVVLPEHLHCIWTLPAGDADFSSRGHAIKARFTRAIPVGE